MNIIDRAIERLEMPIYFQELYVTPRPGKKRALALAVKKLLDIRGGKKCL